MASKELTAGCEGPPKRNITLQALFVRGTLCTGNFSDLKST